MLSFSTHSADETFDLGRALGECLERGDVVLLLGDLGAGKSVLARGLARGLGVDCPMPSPTFTLMQPYEGRVPFYHFDLYRLDDPDQFYEAGLDEYVFGQGAAVIEWPERADLIPDSCFEITLSRGETFDERRIELQSIGGAALREKRLAVAGLKWRLIP